MAELVAVLDGEVVATLENAAGRTSLHYHDAWRGDADSYPVSLSMPLASRVHAHGQVDPFLWGLLPDNDAVLERWARKFGVSARNAFKLIANVGEDCAGAIQFLAPERVEHVLAAPAAEVAWLNEEEVAARLRLLRDDAAAGRAARDTGQFSLAGAQPKTAFLRQNDRWGIPAGRTPTTHILKPTTTSFDGHAENEHLCMRLATTLGLPTAISEVRVFGDLSVIVVERFDRDTADGELFRIHQEDVCQALSIHPSRKYQNDGGPGVRDIVKLLRSNVYQPPDGNDTIDAAEEDVWRFLDALLFNWLIGGTDAHAKNYSLYIGSQGLVRLAPLYDLGSIFAYPDIDARRAKMAMRVAGKYRLSEIALRHWAELAAEVGVSADALISRARSMAMEIADAAVGVAAHMRSEGVNHAVLPAIVDGIAKQAQAVAAQ